MSIPLIQKPEKDDINTSIIAIKRNIERINMLLGLVDTGGNEPDLSGFATKQELQDAVTELQPVDEVTIGNMHSVTSDAVARALAQQGFSNIKDYWTVTTTPFNFAHKQIKVPPHTIILGNFWANLGDWTNTIFSLLVATFYENISEDNADISAVSMVKSANYEFINNSFSYVNDTDSEQDIYVSVRSYVGFSTQFKYNLNFIKIK